MGYYITAGRILIRVPCFQCKQSFVDFQIAWLALDTLQGAKFVLPRKAAWMQLQVISVASW